MISQVLCRLLHKRRVGVAEFLSNYRPQNCPLFVHIVGVISVDSLYSSLVPPPPLRVPLQGSASLGEGRIGKSCRMKGKVTNDLFHGLISQFFLSLAVAFKFLGVSFLKLCAPLSSFCQLNIPSHNSVPKERKTFFFGQTIQR